MKAMAAQSPLEKLLLQKISTTEFTEEQQKAARYFKDNGLPYRQLEKWRNTDLQKWYKKKFNPDTAPEPFSRAVNEIFECTVHGFDTKVVSVLNGHFYAPEKNRLTEDENGVIIGSLQAAKSKYPAVFEEYFGKAVNGELHGLIAANTMLSEDGVFIFVPDNTVIEKPLQLIKLVNKRGLMLNTRNLIVLGKNSKLTFLHCDDSINHDDAFINTLTEIHVGENASLELYKLQNINDETALINNTFFNAEKNARIRVNVASFNGGMIRNELHIHLNEEGAEADLTGVYLMDKKQHVDNQVYVYHNAPHCNSNELFKGILDDEASGVFNGYVYVARDSQKTNAFQRNNNILMTKTAKIDTMPFLEIYADDVQCSHGATVGQLDEEAMFYMMQRGIPYKDAKMLLMFAFVAEVTDRITIETLRTNIDDMVKKRLRGELSICDRCVLHCTTPDKPIEFDIDLSKI